MSFFFVFLGRLDFSTSIQLYDMYFLLNQFNNNEREKERKKIRKIEQQKKNRNDYIDRIDMRHISVSLKL